MAAASNWAQITMAFMLSNMIALVSLAVYLSVWGVRTKTQIAVAPEVSA
ncbi:MAG: hypothetical protein AAFS13_01780 [Pseudomonadota bacterium]